MPLSALLTAFFLCLFQSAKPLPTFHLKSSSELTHRVLSKEKHMTKERGGSIIFLGAGIYGLVFSLGLPLGKVECAGFGGFPPQPLDPALRLWPGAVCAGKGKGRGKTASEPGRAPSKDQGLPSGLLGSPRASSSCSNLWGTCWHPWRTLSRSFPW